MNHKRKNTDRDLTFRSPRWECFACSDTGIISNSDGLLAQILHEYDFINGIHCGGIDSPVVCHCKAAYQQIGDDGQTVKAGYRDSSEAIREVITDHGIRAVGISVPKEFARKLHSIRRDNWRRSEATMNEQIRQKLSEMVNA